MTGEFEGLIKTSLFSVHEQYGAKLVDFAGWAMPLSYTGTVAEHRAVRGDVGVFDVSHLGDLWVTGPAAEATVGATFTNDPRRLVDGASQYTLCCDHSGGIVDDLILYRLDAQRFLAIPNAANTAEVRTALQTAGEGHDVTTTDVSTRLTMLAVQGPRSLEVVRRLFPTVVDAVDYHGIAELDLGPSDTGWLARTGYTGEVGVEVILPELDAPGYFRELVELGATPAGLGARDTLRLEVGYPLHGNDLTTDTDPYEARLGWAVKLEGRQFRGSERLRAKAAQPPARRLWGVKVVGRGIPRPGMAVHHDGRRVGTVTSGTFSPTLRTGLGLACLDDPLGPGDQVAVDIRGKHQPFDVVRPPFVETDPRGN